ncbi:MAG: ABC transporter substrate-binding protein [Pseudomonadota bacterium]
MQLRVAIGNWLQRRMPGLLCLAMFALVAVPAFALDKLNLQLKYLHQFQFAGYYAALEKGYYREHGLDVSIVEGISGDEPLKNVLAGQSQFGVGSSSLLLERHAGKPVVVLGVVFQHSPYVLLVPRTGSTQTIHDIMGKPVMLSAQSEELTAYLKKEGISLSNLTMLKHSFNPDDLISGKTYGFSAYATNETDVLDKAGFAYQAYTPRSAGIDFYGDNLFTSEQQIKEHPARVKAFREASMRGWHYAMRHQEEIAELILAKYSQRNSREHLLYEAKKMTDLVQPELVEMGYMNPGRWMHIAEVYADLGMLPKNSQMQGFLYDPDPRPDFLWLYRALAAISFLIIVAWLIHMKRLSQERKLAQANIKASEERYRRLFSESTIAQVVYDIDNLKILAVNARYLQLLGYAENEVIGCPVDFPFDVNHREEMRSRLHQVVQDGIDNPEATYRGRWHYQHRDGHHIEVEGTSRRLEYANHRARIASLEDVTERERIKQELEKYKSHLEEMVLSRTTELIAAKHMAEAANRAKSVFLANMSHELRTPLNAILGFTQLMKRDNIAPENQKNLATINRAGQHLLSLINDVLEISRIEAGRTLLQSAPFDLGEILSSVEEMIRVKADDKGLKFITEHAGNLPAFVEGDGPHLKQVLINLLGNAVKYTERGQLALSVSRRNGEINFEVSDTGPGISEQDHARIFQPFYQTQSGIAKGEGTGLGLAISQEYTKMMKGRLAVKSQLGQGSTFTLSLPLPETEAPAAQSAARSIIGLEVDQEEMRVLIVDDKEDNRELVMQLLAPTGFALRTANDGQQAIDCFIAWQPQLIWMDMRMPVLDGYQATQQIRALPGGDKVKIVALTASAFEEERQKIIESGCDDMVRKPLEEASLFLVMGDLLNLRYRYAEVEQAAVTPAQTNLARALDFSTLPSSQIAALKAAAEALDLAKIRQQVAMLKETHPALAAEMDELVQGFRFEQIAALCDKSQTQIKQEEGES